MTYKKCIKCGEIKAIDDFFMNKPSKDGRLNSCKKCHSNYFKKYYKENKDKVLCRTSINRSKNKEKYSIKVKEWVVKNPSRYRAIQAKRKAAKINASVKWADKEKIVSIYAMARFLTVVTFGNGYHVDHIIPLQNKNVCGLHCEHNLQILRAEDNIKKGNRI